MITKEILHGAIMMRLEGQPYSAYNGNLCSIHTIVSQLLQEEGFNTKDILYSTERQTITLAVCDKAYRKFPFMTATIKKAKGASHSRYGETWTDYTIKDVEIDFSTKDTLEDAIQDARCRRDENTRAKANELAELEKKVLEIQEALGMERVSEVMTLCYNIYQHRYDLFK